MHFPCPVQVWSDGAIQRFPSHTFFLWTPGNRHTFGNVETEWQHYWLHCAGAFVEELVASSAIQVNRPLPFINSSLPDEYLKLMKNELKYENFPDFSILKSYLTLWVRMIVRNVHPQKHHSLMPERIQKCLSFLSTHLSEPLSLAQIAVEANISASHFSAEFQRCVGASPIAFLLAQRLKHAAMLLRDKNQNIQQVAESSGFQDAFYFSRQFKKSYGLCPSEYRKRFFPTTDC